MHDLPFRVVVFHQLSFVRSRYDHKTSIRTVDLLHCRPGADYSVRRSEREVIEVLVHRMARCQSSWQHIRNKKRSLFAVENAPVVRQRSAYQSFLFDEAIALLRGNSYRIQVGLTRGHYPNNSKTYRSYASKMVRQDPIGRLPNGTIEARPPSFPNLPNRRESPNPAFRFQPTVGDRRNVSREYI